MKGNVKWGATGLILGLAAALSIPSFAQTTPPASSGTGDRAVTVTGTATIKSAPDEAVVTLGVHTQAATAEAAMQQNASKMSEVVKALLDAGIKQSDIATAGISLYPNYSNDGLAIVGYAAENQVNATIRDMNKVGQTIDRAVAAGANLSNGITFQVSDQNEGLDEALQAAVEDARHKAEVLAAAGDARLGQMLQVTESGAPTPPPLYRDVMAAEAASTPVSPPTIETQVSVTVVWALS
jgi:uncharacterized protein YggE